MPDFQLEESKKSIILNLVAKKDPEKLQIKNFSNLPRAEMLEELTNLKSKEKHAPARRDGV